VKLIAEPWDVGEGGYQVGNFPVLWCEWNGRYRDTVRRYWKGDEGQVNDFAYRLTGSSDLYQNTSKNPTASINFITAHDGFTLLDLVSYNDKHNEANGEGNQDGESNNNSWNCGAEGETDSEEILELRARQQRNFLTTLFLSQGVPMLCGGDEAGRSKGGNNNTYCQDNELTWQEWTRTEEQERMLEFTCKLIAFRNEHPIFHRPKFFQGKEVIDDLKDINWLRPDGGEMDGGDWDNLATRAFGILLSGDDMGVTTFEGQPITDDTFYLCFNAYHEKLPFHLPGKESVSWQLVLDTAEPDGFVMDAPEQIAGSEFTLQGRSFSLFKQVVGSDEEARENTRARPGQVEKREPGQIIGPETKAGAVKRKRIPKRVHRKILPSNESQNSQAASRWNRPHAKSGNKG
jgi:isoamylase